MSHKADIDEAFKRLHKAITDRRGEIMTAHFEVFESLEWDDSAREVVEEMINRGLDAFIDGNMRCYLET